MEGIVRRRDGWLHYSTIKESSKNPLRSLESEACRHGDRRNIMPTPTQNYIPLLSVSFAPRKRDGVKNAGYPEFSECDSTDAKCKFAVV
jgi:hypothetical protein